MPSVEPQKTREQIDAEVAVLKGLESEGLVSIPQRQTMPQEPVEETPPEDLTRHGYNTSLNMDILRYDDDGELVHG